jgi:hypothetical protein
MDAIAIVEKSKRGPSVYGYWIVLKLVGEGWGCMALSSVGQVNLTKNVNEMSLKSSVHPHFYHKIRLFEKRVLSHWILATSRASLSFSEMDRKN